MKKLMVMFLSLVIIFGSITMDQVFANEEKGSDKVLNSDKIDEENTKLEESRASTENPQSKENDVDLNKENKNEDQKSKEIEVDTHDIFAKENVEIAQHLEDNTAPVQPFTISVFDPSQWTIDTATDPSLAILTSYNDTLDKDIYIPGEYNFGGSIGVRSIQLSDLNILKNKAESIVIEKVNNKKVSLGTQSLYAALAGDTTLQSAMLSGLDTSNVTDMGNMFNGASGLTSLDVSNWDTSNVRSMYTMFAGASGLTSLDVSNWDTSNVSSMFNMFLGASGLTNLDLSNWDTSNVTNMSYMFSRASGLTNLDLSNWDTSNVTNMEGIFYGASGLTSLDISNWDTSNVTYMYNMFLGASGLTNLDVSNWDTSSVIYMYGMFDSASGLTSLDVSNWDTSNVIDMHNMFYAASGLTNLDLSNWDTSSVIDMNGMFAGASGLTNLDLSNWDTSSVTDMNRIFFGTDRLISLTLGRNFKFLEGNSLPPATILPGYTLQWRFDGPPEETFVSTDDFMDEYNANMKPGTYYRVRAQYTITYNLDGGTNDASNPSNYAYGVGVASFAPATKEGYTFVEWQDESGNVVTSITETDLGNKVLNAVFEANEYTITYNLNGGTNDASNPSNYTYGVGVSNFAPATKEGYTFIEWQDEAGTTITSITGTDLGNKVLNAVYEANEYTITYNLNGGTNNTSNPSNYTYGVGVSNFAPATKEGYTFIEWQDESGNVVTSITETDLGNKVLNAIWKSKPKDKDVSLEDTEKLPNTGVGNNNLIIAVYGILTGGVLAIFSRKKKTNKA